MVDRVQNLRNAVSDGLDRWHVNVTYPYCNAYADAFDGYTKTMKAQADADKARAELFVSLASIVTGSILMATVAESSLRVVVADAALNVICNRNLERTFNAMVVMSDNKTFMFAIGKVLDTVDDQLGKTIKEEATKILSNGHDIKTSNPQVKQNELESIMLKHKISAITTAERIEANSRLSEAQKHVAFNALLSAPICRPPNALVHADTLSKKLELCIYLQAILDSDELVDWGPYYGGPDRRPIGSHPIPQLPSARDYPNPIPPTTGAGQTVGINRPTSMIRDRVNDLHKAVFKEPFYDAEGFFSRAVGMIGDNATGPQKVAELKKAESQIDKLSKEVRPASLLDVKS